jgi:hypothetical protein
MPKTNTRVSEDAIDECRLELASSIIDGKYATINGKKVYKHNLLEDADPEDLANITLMLFADKDDALDHAVEILKQRFDVMFDDAEIAEHILDERKDLALERHLEEAYDYE